MRYPEVLEAEFVKRPNRFVAFCLLGGREVKVHVKNTGRCKELLLPGAKVFLERASHQNRKTAFSLVAVKKGDRIVNIDSQAPNEAVYEALMADKLSLPGMNGKELITREVSYHNSRLDMKIEGSFVTGFVETKGVTLEIDNKATFPDAPTVRGVKHLQSLAHASQAGYMAYVIFVIQMKGVDLFLPNDGMHPQFGDALREAVRGGVIPLAYDCEVTPDSLTVAESVTVNMEGFNEKEEKIHI